MVIVHVALANVGVGGIHLQLNVRRVKGVDLATHLHLSKCWILCGLLMEFTERHCLHRALPCYLRGVGHGASGDVSLQLCQRHLPVFCCPVVHQAQCAALHHRRPAHQRTNLTQHLGIGYGVIPLVVFIVFVLAVVLGEEVHPLCLDVKPRQHIGVSRTPSPYSRKNHTFDKSAHLVEHFQEQRTESLKRIVNRPVHVDGVKSTQHVIQPIRRRVKW